jgi:hypothetical protein
MTIPASSDSDARFEPVMSPVMHPAERSLGGLNSGANNGAVDPPPDPRAAYRPVAQRASRRPQAFAPVPVNDGVERVSLRERLDAPLKVVALGLVLSLVDVVIRQMEIQLPVRPIWIAEVLVVLGMLWALFRVFLARD